MRLEHPCIPSLHPCVGSGEHEHPPPTEPSSWAQILAAGWAEERVDGLAWAVTSWACWLCRGETAG